jgi:hypothetical protein
MPAEASQEVRVLLNRLDGKVVNFPRVADNCDELDNMAERNPFPVTTLPDCCYEGVAVCRVRTKCDLGQGWWGSFG